MMEVLGHVATTLAFAGLATVVATRRRQFRRTLRSGAPIAYGIVATSIVMALINIYCALDLLFLHQTNSPLYALHALSHHPAVIIVSMLLLALTSVKMVAERSPRPRRVLAIGAHPDDLEIACGATLAKMRDAGHAIHAMVLTGGEAGGDPVIRVREAHSGAAFLGLNSVEVLNFNDTALAEQVNEITRAIEARIHAYHPDIILTHSAHDQHQDHLAVHQATMRAARNHGAILCYESPSVTRDFLPTFFVDIGDYVDVKIAGVRTHADQRAKSYVSAERLRGTAVFRGGQAKTRYAEGFEVVRAISSSLGDM